MLDIRKIRAGPEEIKQRLATRIEDVGTIDELLTADEHRRESIAQQDELRAKRNENAKSTRQTTSEEERDAIRTQGRELSRLLSDKEALVRKYEARVKELHYQIPNLPHTSVPVGKDERSNEVVGEWGDVPEFDFDPKPHWEVGEPLGLDIPMGVGMAGSRFYVLKGQMALLELALVQFMIDFHVARGYTPVIPPFMVTEEAMYACAQLPKFEDGLYSTPRDLTNSSAEMLYLIPTAESALASLHKGEVLDAESMPLRYVGYSPCFRRETSAGGRDVRGIKRVHQFTKVELFKFVTPESSYDELESLTDDAERILGHLEIPYRKTVLSSGDMSFASSKTYDLEVWLPSERSYSEVSSCSNVEDFQARRLQTRCCAAPGSRPEYVHMLNGSGLAIGRTALALLENHQRRDGSVAIPAPLRPYIGGRESLQPEPALTK